MWDVTGQQPHALVLGPAGSGTSATVRGLVTESCARGWPVWICDPSYSSRLAGLHDWPNVQIVATTAVDQCVVLQSARREMSRRYEQILGGAAASNFDPLIIVIDGLGELDSAVSRWYDQVKEPGMPVRCPSLDAVAEITRTGRTARVHLLVTAQRQADVLQIRDDLNPKIVLGRLADASAEFLWPGRSSHRIRRGGLPGRGIIGDYGGPVEVQVYWTPAPAGPSTTADETILERLQPATRTHPQLRVALDEDPRNLDKHHPSSGGEQAPGHHWGPVATARLVPTNQPGVGGARTPRAGERT